MSNREERRHEIGKLIFDAAAKAEGVDWTKDDEAISKAESELNEAMAQYVEEATSQANVRDVYKRWRDLHKVGGLF